MQKLYFMRKQKSGKNWQNFNKKPLKWQKIR